MVLCTLLPKIPTNYPPCGKTLRAKSRQSRDPRLEYQIDGSVSEAYLIVKAYPREERTALESRSCQGGKNSPSRTSLLPNAGIQDLCFVTSCGFLWSCPVGSHAQIGDSSFDYAGVVSHRICRRWIVFLSWTIHVVWNNGFSDHQYQISDEAEERLSTDVPTREMHRPECVGSCPR
jgi:hypothetical protein